MNNRSNLRCLMVGCIIVAAGAASVHAQDTKKWNDLLEAHVSSGKVDYAALASSAQRKKLEQVVRSFADMPESSGLADWINAYNAAVILGVVENYPVKSVMDIKGFFKTKKYRIAGKERTLDEVEHKVIRPRFKDARVHAALNCAAVSCPPLYGRAFENATVDATLHDRTKRWLASDAHVDVAGDRLKVSALFFWFEEDFKREAGSVRKWIVKHAPKRRKQIEAAPKIVKLPYDWRLNGKR